MKGMVNAVAILKIKKHPRTIDALIKWIEQRLFHDEYKAPTEQDLHIWLKHAKKFKREQNNLKVDNAALQKRVDLLDNFSENADETVKELIKENHELHQWVSIYRMLRNAHKNHRRALQRQVGGLRGYKQEVERIAELMYQHTMKRLIIEAGGDERCSYCKRTAAEAEGGYKCSTCEQGGDNETKNDISPKE